MHENNMKEGVIKDITIQPQEEFIRQVIFMKNEEKVLAIFPFFHDISDKDYLHVINTYFDEDPPAKREFCLMHESEFGWGWIHNNLIYHLDVASEDEYEEFKFLLISNNVIKDTFILNEE